DFIGKELTRIPVSPGVFHTYLVESINGKAKVAIDGMLGLETYEVDKRRLKINWSPAVGSPLLFSFGNYPDPETYPKDSKYSTTTMFPVQITRDVTGLSLWKSVEVKVIHANGSEHDTSWSASKDGFPDQYQLDHVIEVEATVSGMDQ